MVASTAPASRNQSWRLDLAASVPERAGVSRINSGGIVPIAASSNADDLDRLATVVMAVGLEVTIMKGLGNFFDLQPFNRARWNRYQQLIGLPRIARIDRTLETPTLGGNSGTVEHRGALSFECDEGGL